MVEEGPGLTPCTETMVEEGSGVVADGSTFTVTHNGVAEPACSSWSPTEPEVSAAEEVSEMPLQDIPLDDEVASRPTRKKVFARGTALLGGTVTRSDEPVG